MAEVELVCAKCGKPGGLSEEVEVESTAYRKLTVKIVDGKQQVERGRAEDAHLCPDERDTGRIHCGHCEAWFHSIEEATDQVTREHQCGTCDWWGLQAWLHAIERPDCDGELTPLSIGSTTAAQKGLAA